MDDCLWAECLDVAWSIHDIKDRDRATAFSAELADAYDARDRMAVDRIAKDVENFLDTERENGPQ